MRIKVESHTVVGDAMLVSGYVDRKINSFTDVSVDVERLVEFIKENHSDYYEEFCDAESMDAEDPMGINVFDQDKILEEIDYKILAEYMKEAGSV